MENGIIENNTKPEVRLNRKQLKTQELLELLGGVPIDEIKQAVKAEVDSYKLAREVHLKIEAPNQIVTTLTGLQHESFQDVVKAISSRCNVVLTGPAGSGKTTLAERAAEVLGLEYTLISCHAGVTDYELFGYRSPATGEFYHGKIYERVVNGGLLILDEADSLDPQVGCALNAILANGVFTFPDNITVKIHDDFKVIATMNTYGLGGNLDYCGRNRLDAATLDRFIMIPIGYSARIESVILGLEPESDEYNPEAKTATPQEIQDLVKLTREHFESNKIKSIVSPRASKNLLALAQVGVCAGKAIEWVVLKGLDKNTAQTLYNKINSGIFSCLLPLLKH